MPSRDYGLAVALAGVMVVSPDAMLLRSMRYTGASLSDVVAAKYFLTCLFFIGLTWIEKDARACALRAPGHFITATGCQLLNQLGFTFALLLTDAAKALLLISLSPLWAALIGWLVLGDSLPRRTLVALVLSFVSVAIIFVPRALGYHHHHRDGTLLGDVLAVATGLAQAGTISVHRHASLGVAPAGANSATLLSMGLSSACACSLALSLPCDPLEAYSLIPIEAARLGLVPGLWACTLRVFTSLAFILYAVLDASCVGCTYIAMTIAPRHISGSEVALILLLEVVTGPLWVFCRFGDLPGPWTIGGGVLLLATLAGYELAGGRDGGGGGGAHAAAAHKRDVVVEADNRVYHRFDGSVLIM